MTSRVGELVDELADQRGGSFVEHQRLHRILLIERQEEGRKYNGYIIHTKQKQKQKQTKK
jgi:hypothetical protein